MIIDRKNYKTNSVSIFKDNVLSFLMDIDNKEIIIKLKDTYDDMGEYSIKFINVIGYNMSPFDFMEDSLSINDFYINLDIKRYEYSSRYEDIDISNYLELVIELNNDDFIKILCEKIEVDNRKIISVAK